MFFGSLLIAQPRIFLGAKGWSPTLNLHQEANCFASVATAIPNGEGLGPYSLPFVLFCSISPKKSYNLEFCCLVKEADHRRCYSDISSFQAHGCLLSTLGGRSRCFFFGGTLLQQAETTAATQICCPRTLANVGLGSE